MPYPEALLPHTHFKRILSDLSGHSVCRTVAKKEMLEDSNAISENLLYESPLELFDYSTNLLGHFRLNDNYITLIGERKKYFRSEWDFAEEVDIPVDHEDFIIDETKGFFFLPIVRIHQKVQIPFKRPLKDVSDSVTAVVVHTPSRSNFWHFSIRWVDKDGSVVKPSNAAWKNQISATMRAALLELIELNVPNIMVLDTKDFTN